MAATVTTAKAMKMGGPMDMMKMMKRPMEFFTASGPDDNCGTVPTDVMTGNVKMMACQGSSAQDELCVCVKPQITAEAMSTMMKMMPDMVEDMNVNPDTGFALKCGHCRDPCSLMFMPTRGPKGDHDHEDQPMGMLMKIPALMTKFADLMDEGKLQEVNPFRMVLETMNQKMDQ
eukprot:TCALIF_10681-PA protein Name:"Protein of unknown function" AED:0.21 eAED:0.21 QI:34/1/0.5/1/1/1/2/0/173